MIDERMTIDGVHQAAEHMERKLIKLTAMQSTTVPRNV
jgi:hypothetical protein